MALFAQFDVAMPRELMKRGVKWQDRAVYSEAILYCRENLTDGVIHRNELPCWMPDLPVKQRTARLDAIATTGALLAHTDGWTFPPHVWGRWNPSKQEVVDKRAAEAERLRKHRERKKAEAYGVRTDVRTRAATRAYKQPEPEPEPEPEQPPLIPPDGSNNTPPASVEPMRKERVIDAYVRIGLDAARQRGPIRSEPGMTRHLHDQATANPDLNRWLDMFPDAPPDAVAGWLHGAKGSMQYYRRADEIAAADDGPEIATIHELPRRDTA
ncbi:MAG: hypothetical protein WCC60_06630 [Ilumatobacteraceae bacterium]